MIAWAPGIAYADFMYEFSGNTRAAAEGTVVDGSISFAVWDSVGHGGGTLTGAVPGDTFVHGSGSGSAGIGEARYVYLYQIVNDGTNDMMINDFTVYLGANASDISAWGYFEDISLADSQGAVGSNNRFGDDVPAFGVAGSVAPANTDWSGNTGSFAVDEAGTVEPNVGVGIVTGGGSDTFRAYFSFLGENPISAGTKSCVLAFSSDVAPTFNLVTFKDSVEYLAQGTVASPTPEPSTVVGLLSLLPLGLIALRRRRRGNSTS